MPRIKEKDFFETKKKYGNLLPAYILYKKY